jgi:hypothetical protein
MRRYRFRKVIHFAVYILAISIVLIFAQKYNNEHLDKESKAKKNDEILCSENKEIECNELPVISIELSSDHISKEVYIFGQLTQYYPESNRDYEYDFKSFSEKIALKYRGDSSYSLFDKRQYKIEFRDDEELESRIDKSLIGMNKNDDWAFYGPFIDPTLMHNKLMYTLSGEMFEWAPSARYFELYINGNYEGVYLAVEYPSGDEARLNLSDFSLFSGETPYLVQRNDIGFGELEIPTYGQINNLTYFPVTLKYPNTEDITRKELDYISSDFSKFEEKLYTEDFLTATDSYRNDIDLQSFVDYLIINEFAMIKDAGFQSMFMYKRFEGKLTATVWDFNNAFDHYVYSSRSLYEWTVVDNNWYKQFMQDEVFVSEFIKRYKELRRSTLSTKNVLSLIDENYDLIKESADRNFEKYGYIFEESIVAKRSDDYPTNFDEAIDRLRYNVKERLEYMDSTIDEFYIW